MQLILILAGITLIVVLGETVLWTLFRRQAAPLCFEAEADMCSPRRLNMRALGLFALGHGGTLLVISWVYLILLW